MKQAFYENMPYVDLALLAFAIFAIIFAVAMVRIATRRKAELDELAALPLNDVTQLEGQS